MKENVKNLIVNAGPNSLSKNLKKGLLSITGSRKTLANNEIKDIIEVIRSLNSKRIFLKRTNENAINKKEGSLAIYKIWSIFNKKFNYFIN